MQERSAFWEGNKKFSQAFCVIWRNLIPSYTLQIIKEKNLIAISGKKTFFLVSGKIRFLFPYDWALELGSAATTATNKTTNILPCYWNPIADYIKNLECCKTVPYDSPLTPPPSWTPRVPHSLLGPPYPHDSRDPLPDKKNIFRSPRRWVALFHQSLFDFSLFSLSLSLTAMKLFEECVNSQQMRNRRYGGLIFTTPIFFIQITKKFGDVTSMTYIRFGFGYRTCRSWNWELIPEG